MNFYHDEKNAKSYVKMCEGYDAKVELKTLYDTVRKGSSLLELGTGPGNDLALLAGNYNVVGSDTSPIFLDMLATRFPDLELLELNAISIETGKFFNVIYSNKVLHHLNDEDLQTSFNRQAQMINSGGYIYHLIWRKVESPDDNFGLEFIPRDETKIKEMLKDKFEIVSIKAYAEFEEDDSLAILARKK